MAHHLAVSIYLHDARYHGVNEWPPAPARVFQALVAGAAHGATLPERARVALEWLERLPPPTIASPRTRVGQAIDMFVPNNDADALDGDLDKLPEIRTKKTQVPRLLEESLPFHYIWSVDEASAPANSIVELADDLYQFGRGIDMAWATARLCERDAVEHLLNRHVGAVHKPTGGGVGLACPTIGSLASLVERHHATTRRLRTEGTGKDRTTLFAQPPKARFANIGYDASASQLIYELRDASDDTRMFPVPLRHAVSLIEQVRDAAVEKLREALPESKAAIERGLIGRQPNGPTPGSPEERVRILPLPSIGHKMADQAIRRIMVEVPPRAPLPVGDLHWAFSALEPHDHDTGEVRFVATPAVSAEMGEHYLRAARTWRTITPAALPEAAKRRRIEPSRKRAEAKGAAERLEEEARAIAAVHTALRHAGVRERTIQVRVQREPFDLKGAFAERFAHPPRFPKERLWHIEIEFAANVRGPLALGDGRFLGLGVMAPAQSDTSVFAFEIVGPRQAPMDAVGVSRALRRAVIARAQAHWGSGTLPPFFTGHEASGDPIRADQPSHLAFQVQNNRLLILAPNVLSRRVPTSHERNCLDILERALEGMTHLNVGRLGRLEVARLFLTDDESPLLRRSRLWTSANPYAVNRHLKGSTAGAALTQDILESCRQQHLPRPEVLVESLRALPGRGLEGRVRLRFEVAVRGPVILGRTRFLGGGLFTSERES